jgi:hypothetical protein
MRRETVHMARQAVSQGRRASVRVNNRSEGNAPLTVQALSELLGEYAIVSIREAAPCADPKAVRMIGWSGVR